MASRKKVSESSQLGFDIPSVTPPDLPTVDVVPVGFDVDSLDDHLEDTARATLEDPPLPKVTIFVECVGKDFEVCRLYENGIAYAKVTYSRTELRELIRLATEAIEDRP